MKVKKNCNIACLTPIFWDADIPDYQKFDAYCGDAVDAGTIFLTLAPGGIAAREGLAARAGGIAATMPEYPKPPGWTADWDWRYPEGTAKSSPRWFDPNGGEWRWHAPDRWHSEGHWDHNPWTQWNSKWENHYPDR
jgi:hypothetical protein